MYNALLLTRWDSTRFLEQEVNDSHNAAFYFCFAIMSLLAGGLNNILGPRILTAIGSTGYAICTASRYNINRYYTVPDSAETFFIISGAYLGLCAGMLWAAQGQICLTYPTEPQKGTFFAIFWIIYNLGAVLGETIPMAQSWSIGYPDISETIYLIFIVLMVCGSIVAFLIQPPGTIIREDQTQIQTAPTNVLREFIEVLKLFTNPAMLTILIPCISSNWFYMYQFGPFGYNFSGRSKSLNAIFYWLVQAPSAWVFGKIILDNSTYSRITRVWTGCYLMIGVTVVFFGGGVAFEYSSTSFGWIDAVDNFGQFFGPFILFICYGIYDAFFQVYTNYLIGAISNDSETLSRYAGFYKGTQSGARGISWVLTRFVLADARRHKQYSNAHFWVMVGPCVVSLFFFTMFCKFYVKDTTKDIGQSKQSDIAIPFPLPQSPQPQQTNVTPLPTNNSSVNSDSVTLAKSDGDFLVAVTTTNNSAKKTTGTMFDAMNSVSQLPLQTSGLSKKISEAAEDSRETLQMAWFGDLQLPALPSQWSVRQVKAWASKNEATPIILQLIESEQIDGRTFLMSTVDDFTFPTMGHRIRFRNALESLKVINERGLRSADEPAAPPEYEI
ncbi:DUF895 domain membrane protein [Rhizoclosmatium hyalinum]|nr:DUF895 domain membrane protein [Rhizoclosmatium hyalinum]